MHAKKETAYQTDQTAYFRSQFGSNSHRKPALPCSRHSIHRTGSMAHGCSRCRWSKTGCLCCNPEKAARAQGKKAEEAVKAQAKAASTVAYNPASLPPGGCSRCDYYKGGCFCCNPDKGARAREGSQSASDNMNQPSEKPVKTASEDSQKAAPDINDDQPAQAALEVGSEPEEDRDSLGRPAEKRRRKDQEGCQVS